MDTEKLKLYLDFARFVLASVVLASITFWVNSGFKDREIAIMEQEYLAQFKADALNEDIEIRRRLAEYFSKVTVSDDARHRWTDYLGLLTEKQTAQADNEVMINELERQLAMSQADNERTEEIVRELEQAKVNAARLELQLNKVVEQRTLLIGEQGWVSSVWLSCDRSESSDDQIC